MPGTEVSECPVSYITPQSNHLVERYRRERSAIACTGSSLMGPDRGNWPARLVDAFVTLEREQQLLESLWIRGPGEEDDE